MGNWVKEGGVAQSSERSISPTAWPSFRRSVNRLRSAGETLARSAAMSGSVEPNSQMAPTPMQPSARISSLLLMSPNSSNDDIRALGCMEIGRAHVELQSPDHLVCRLLLEKKKNEPM